MRTTRTRKACAGLIVVGYIAMIVGACMLGGCAADTPRLYIERQRDLYQWFAPRMRGYVAGDNRVSEAQKAADLKAIDLWHADLLAQERRFGIKPPLPKPPIALPRPRAR